MEIGQLGREIFATIYEGLLADGHINPDGKTEAQIMAEVRNAALKWSKHRPMLVATDFRNSLLSKARSLKQQKNYHEASLYYATWFEHWINGVLLRKLKLLDVKEANQMIRDVSLRGKYTWLLALIHERRIRRNHLISILRVCDLRNEFVHYKYKLVDVDRIDSDRSHEALRAAEAAVRYLLSFEERHFFKGSARGLLKKLRITKHES